MAVAVASLWCSRKMCCDSTSATYHADATQGLAVFFALLIPSQDVHALICLARDKTSKDEGKTLCGIHHAK